MFGKMIRPTVLCCAALTACETRETNQVDFDIGGANDPVVRAALSAAATFDPCGTSTTTGQLPVVADVFSGTTARDPNWPMNDGWDGEFAGDWYTDGITARVHNPKWDDPSAPHPARVTGFYKFVGLCPGPGLSLRATAGVDTSQYSNTTSDTTLVVYFFDATGALINHVASFPMHKGNNRRLAIEQADVPCQTRFIAVAPMARLDHEEQMSVFYRDISVTTRATSYAVHGSVAENFSSFDSEQRNVTGWTEFNGDWFVDPNYNFATLYNSAWGGDPAGLPPIEAGLTRTFPLSNVQAGDTFAASVFAASTFNDSTSFVTLRATFDAAPAQVFESPRSGGSTWELLTLSGVAIPAGSSQVTVTVLAYLGPQETSSLYIDDFSARWAGETAPLIATKIYTPTRWHNARSDFDGARTVTIPASVPIDTQNYSCGGQPSVYGLAPGNSGNHGLQLSFVTASGNVMCTYRGGADVSRPGTNASQLAKAVRYNLQSCSNGATSGQSIVATGAALTVLNGDSSYPSTRARLDLSLSAVP